MKGKGLFFLITGVFIISLLWVLDSPAGNILSTREAIKGEDSKDVHGGKGEKGEEEHERKRKKRRGFVRFQYDKKSGHYFIDTRRYHAEFLPGEMRYTPKKKKGEGRTIVFKSLGFFQGGKRLFPDDSKVEARVIDDTVLAFKRKDYVEHYEIKGHGFNQGWTIKTPVNGDGDLILRASISTEYKLEPRGEEGFLIKDGEIILVDFKQLSGVDYTGRKVDLKTVLKGKDLEVIFPKDFLKQAKFPIAINPPVKGKRADLKQGSQ